MCGVAGLSVGVEAPAGCLACPLGRRDPEAPGSKASQRWHGSSGVRNGPVHSLAATSLERPLFPIHRVPVAQSALVRELSEASHRLIGARHLYRYMQFTAELEVLVVNQVVATMATGRAPFAVSDELRIASMQIYTDEAYHALVAQTIANDIGRLADYQAPSVWVGVERRLGAVITKHPGLPPEFVRTLFVYLSETLITGNLRDLSTAPDLDEGARAAIKEHARDEGRHHVLFRDLLPHFWSSVPSRHRTGLLSLVADLVLCFFAPERAAVELELRDYGLAPRQCSDVVEEAYLPETVRASALLSARQSLGYLSELPGADMSVVSAGFDRAEAYS